MPKTLINTPNNQQKIRVYEVDVLRGMAIVMMVIFHFCYDLAVFDWLDINTSQDIEWKVFRNIIVSAFLSAVGMSSYLAYSKRINLQKLTKSTAKLLFIALLISVGSLFMYPKYWVYFGIIHFIAIALPISALFVRIPNAALILAIMCLVSYQFGWISMKPLWLWSVDNFNIPQRTKDLVSFIPWISAVLIGIYLMHKQLFHLSINSNTLTNTLAKFGQHSLFIYLLHQPIMYGAMLTIKNYM